MTWSITKRADRGFVLRVREPGSTRVVERQLNALTRKAAERQAAKLMRGGFGPDRRPTRLTWAEFRDRFEAEKLPRLSVRTQQSYDTALDHVERLMRPKWLAEATTAWVSEFHRGLRDGTRRETTIASILRHVKSALRWAHLHELLAVMPRVELPERARGRKGQRMKGRPVLEHEFEAMLAAVPAVERRNPEGVARMLTLLWLSGLRLGEGLRLSWDAAAPVSVHLAEETDGPWAVIRFAAEGHKRNEADSRPMPGDLARWLAATPREQRTGPVVRLESPRVGGQVAVDWASRRIVAIGEASGVLVNPALGKFASAHDLRRGFALRWHKAGVPLPQLQKMLGHSNIGVTIGYYANEDAEAIARELGRLPVGESERLRYNRPAVANAGDNRGDAAGCGSSHLPGGCEAENQPHGPDSRAPGRH